MKQTDKGLRIIIISFIIYAIALFSTLEAAVRGLTVVYISSLTVWVFSTGTMVFGCILSLKESIERRREYTNKILEENNAKPIIKHGSKHTQMP